MQINYLHFVCKLIICILFALILRELEFIGLISPLLSNLSMFGILLFGIYWEISYGQLWRDSTWVFLRVLLRDMLRHSVWVWRHPVWRGVWRRKVSRRLLTKLLVFINTAHARSYGNHLSLWRNIPWSNEDHYTQLIG